MIYHGQRYTEFEVVERDAWQDMFAAAPARTAEALRLSHHRIGGMGLLASTEVPITELNRVMAVDAERDASEAELVEASLWLEARTAAWAFQVGPAARHTPTLAWLRARNLKPTGNGWAKHVVALFHDRLPAASDLDVREADLGNAQAFGAAAQSGFGLPEATAPWFAALVGRPGWRAYLVLDGDRPAAAAAMYTRDSTAWFGIDATQPHFRGRGAHAALIARRIADSRSMGVAGGTAETGYPGADDTTPFSSFRNYQRAGFALAYVRPNYKPL